MSGHWTIDECARAGNRRHHERTTTLETQCPSVASTRVRRRARHAPHVDRGRACLLERARQLGNCAAGGDHVVDDHDPASTHGPLAGRESTLQIGVPIGRSQADLRSRVASANREPRCDGERQRAGGEACDLGRLVEAALRVPARMQGSRKQAVDIELQAEIRRVACEKPAEHAADCQLPAVLERLDQSVDRRCVGTDGERSIARRAAVGIGRRHLAAQATAGQDREAPLARDTQVVTGPLPRPTAEHATRREQIPEQALPAAVNQSGHVRLTAAAVDRNTRRARSLP